MIAPSSQPTTTDETPPPPPPPLTTTTKQEGLALQWQQKLESSNGGVVDPLALTKDEKNKMLQTEGTMSKEAVRCFNCCCRWIHSFIHFHELLTCLPHLALTLILLILFR
jgi:hypothetical protein